METVNLVLAIVSLITSLILSGFAIWLSIIFYNKSKDTDKEVNEALTEIKTHAAALERLTGRWMDRLTKHVTTPQPADEITTKLFELITVSYTGVGPRMATPSEEETKRQLVAQLISTYIAIFYYCGLTNIASQSYLPLNEEDADTTIRGIIDSSHADYTSTLQSLSGVSDADLRASPLHNLYEIAIQWKESVRNSSMVYAERASSS